MKPSNHRKRNKRLIVILIALAFLCIGCAELIACAVFAPETFRRVTAPVSSAFETVVETGQSVANELTQWFEDLKARRTESDSKELPEAQVAGAPVITNSAPILDPAITELVTEADVATLTGGIVPVIYYNQGEAPWAEQPYGSDDIGKYGCGPAAMAMAVQSMTGTAVNPVQMAEAAVDAGHWASKQGSYLSIVSGLAADYGLLAEALEEKTPDAVVDALLSGKLLVALMGPGHFTTKGHFILIRGVTLQGTLLVADPNSTERSLQEWDAQIVLNELSDSTEHGAPLWTLSLP